MQIFFSYNRGGSMKKSSLGSPGTNKQASYDGTMIKGISTQEAIVERAKQVPSLINISSKI
jgi:hypothetical protein